ncbi:hypothetical protein [Micromonospora sp. WMMC273]|uniref:hypothetical protein n=1 Tax=Micromonospora sp. WMMC273 TaxID=3015157 RepID=UPI0022B68CAA|nr:hypothetical protein [Micromonospora sp. WMMC273]MCZ7478831.1 hypothetical protein [Micromonospora sp. WMMC273]MCZ7478959.1 hypothetical protein [Micromonospora sp. WMMC273]MCZ7479007.1 hypothetical protein [Micromonospora sp. WMMC273]
MSARHRYVLEVNNAVLRLEPQEVLPFVRGFAQALNQVRELAVLDTDAPEDTKRMQAMQIGHQLGWWDYRYIER